jgi:ABC-type Fe3+-siderophore transport system permease subunit
MTNNTMSASKSKRYAWLFVLLLFLLIIMIVSLCIGAKPISMDMLWNILMGEEHGLAKTIVIEGRLPRTLNGLFVGMALGTSGALIQAITRNPLADPGILGVNLGASLAIAIAIVFRWQHWRW